MKRIAKWHAALASVVLAVAASTARAENKDIVDTAADAGSFKTLAAALGAADLVAPLKGTGPFTVFAPTDEAFEKLPKGTVENLLKPENKQQLIDILTYHVVSGDVPAAKVVNLNGAKTLNGQQVDIKSSNGKVTIDAATVVQTDIACSNGVIHVIDSVIMPATDDIPTTATKAGSFKTLVAAVKAAGLADVLSGSGPFTVFAPTDEAFQRLPAGTVESLLKPENKAKLADILKYHVVAGRVYSSDALAAGKAKTLQGSTVNIAVQGDAAKVNGVKLVATDLDASNGVIHVIDAVLLPPSSKQGSVHPRKMIETAINQGAPLYNRGHSSGCARVYMTTVKTLLSTEDPALCHSTRQTLQSAMTRAQHSSCSDTQAWTLRHALDQAYNSMASVR